jgi:GT2 family glycosyltransferase
VRELLPDWLLSPAYAFRRAFLPRHGVFRLTREQEGRFRLSPDASRLPHGRVLFRPSAWPAWDALELDGSVWVSGSSVRWSRWLDPPGTGNSMEVELPYGLRDLTARLLPDPRGVHELVLELHELGTVWATRAALADGPGPVLRELVHAADGEGPARSWLGAVPWRTVRAGIDAAGYTRWLRTFETPSARALDRLRARASSSGLRVSIVTAPRPDGPELASQLPGNVELVGSFEKARGEILVPLGAGVRLAPHALPTLLSVFHERPEVMLIHADHDRSVAGRRVPEFKPVFGPELVRSRNVLRGVVAVRRSKMLARGDPTLDDASFYAWGLACTAGLSPEHILRLPVVLATLEASQEMDEAGERRALAQHLHRTGVQAEVAPGLAPGLHHVRYRLPEPAPLVTLVVPTRNARALVETCVRSVRRLTRYASYEIHLVDNGSDAPDALAAFDSLALAGDVVLHRDPRPFNFSALNNAAVRRTEADVVCLLNNDVEALHAEWLEEMVSVALQPGVGAVGAKLFYPDGRIQHGGVLIGLHGAADHAYAGAPGDAPGHAQQLLVRREVSAVTAACLVVRRALYLEVGGLDEEAFPVAFNDVDFCLKLRERGYRNVWTPHARLVHHESASRGKRLLPAQKARADRELAALRTRWAAALLDDPYHSPNLSLSSNVPRLAWPPRERRPWSI